MRRAVGVARAGSAGASAVAFAPLPDGAGATAELAAMKEIAGGLVDVVRHNMRDMMGYSLFLIGNRELVMDLLFERVAIFLYMDFEKFFALAAKQGVTLRWATRKETQRATKLTNAIPGSPGAHGVVGFTSRIPGTDRLLEAHQAVVARRSAQSLREPSVDEWKALWKAIRQVYSDAPEAED